MVCKIGIVGCGTVGGGLVKLLADRRDYLREKYGFEFELCFISDFARGTASDPQGLYLPAAVKSLVERGNLEGLPAVRFGEVSLAELIASTGVDIVCDATPTNYRTGTPSLGILRTALSNGASAVTSSKGGVGLELIELKKLAADNGVTLRYESSVLSGTPLINLVRGPLAGCSIERVEGIVNGTTNYILTKMEEGADYAAALAEAQKLGYAESDPTGDVEGFDAAVKVCIMSGEFFGRQLTIAEVERTGSSGVTPGDIKKAAAEGKRVKLIAGAELTKEGVVKGYVRPTAMPYSHPLAGVNGVINAVTITTDNLGDVTIIGPGAGARETAQGMLADILEIREKR